MTLAGKTLFISGGSRGIGLAIALRAAPSRAARSAMASPMPRLPPEMNKVVPASVISGLPRARSGP